MNLTQQIKNMFPNHKETAKDIIIGNIYGEKGKSCKINKYSGLWCDFENQTSGSFIDIIRINKFNGNPYNKKDKIKETLKYLNNNEIKIDQYKKISKEKQKEYKQYTKINTITINQLPENNHKLKVLKKYLKNRNINHIPHQTQINTSIMAFHNENYRKYIISFNAIDQNFQTGCQKLYLNQNAEKLNPPRKSFGNIKGAHIKINQTTLGNTLYITEGIEDALSIAQIKPNANIIATLGKYNLLSQPIIQKYPNIIFCLDNDTINPKCQNTANQNMEKLIAQIINLNISKFPNKNFYTIIPKHYKDLNEALCNQNENYLEKIISQKNRVLDTIKNM